MTTYLQLTEEQMRAMHFARSVDLDPDFNDGAAAAKSFAWECETVIDPETEEIDRAATEARAAENVTLYEQGKALLKNYSLDYTHRRVVLSNADWQQLPGDVSGALVVNAGHIATSPAYRIAYARLRPKTLADKLRAAAELEDIDKMAKMALLADTGIDQTVRETILAKYGSAKLAAASWGDEPDLSQLRNYLNLLALSLDAEDVQKRDSFPSVTD